MCADPANFTDPDGRAGIPFLQDFKKSMLGECVVGSIQALGGAFGIAGLMSIGGTIGNVVSGVLSIGTTANSIKNMAQLANEGSKVGQGGSFNMSNELIGEINSHGNVGMRFSGARNEGGVDGDPKKKQSSDLLYKPVSQPSDRLYTTAEMERNLLYSNLYKGFMPEPPVSAFQLYKENEINLMQMFYRWDQSFSDAARVPFTIFAEMLPPVSLYMSYTGRDLNNNPLSTTGRCFAAAGGFLGIGELKFALNGAAKGGMSEMHLVTRAAQKAEAAIGGSGGVAGTLKHTYSKNLLSRYQSMYGGNLSLGSNYFNGPAGRGFLDAVNHSTKTIYDFKFGNAFMSNSQFLKYSNSFPGYGIQIIKP